MLTVKKKKSVNIREYRGKKLKLVILLHPEITSDIFVISVCSPPGPPGLACAVPSPHPALGPLTS